MNYKILLMPAFRSHDDAYRTLAAMACYAAPFRQDIGMITAFYRGDDVVDLDLTGFFQNPKAYLSEDFSEDMNDIVGSFAKLVRVLPDETGLLDRTMEENFELVYCWTEKQPADLKQLQRFADVADADIVTADPAKQANAVMASIRGMEKLAVSLKGHGIAGMSDEARIKRSRTRFLQFMDAVNEKGVILLGPDRAALDDQTLAKSCDDRVVIICDELITGRIGQSGIKPDLICMADPQRLLGLSKASQDFRSGLRSAMAETDATIVCSPLAQIYLNLFLPAAAQGRVIAIPQDNGDVNIALHQAFRTRAGARHGLTAFMLPIAMSLSHDIIFSGFPGLVPGEDVAVNDAGDVTPSVDWIAIDQEIDTFLKMGENRGKQFRNVQASGLPSLAKIWVGDAA